MTTQTHTPADVQGRATPAAGATHPAPTATAQLAGPDGRDATTVADGVVAKIAGIAIQEIEGVYALGGGAARALGTLREKVGQKDLTQGVSVVDDEVIATGVSRRARLAAGLAPGQVTTTVGGRALSIRVRPTSGFPVDQDSIRAAVDAELAAYALDRRISPTVHIMGEGAVGR